MREREVEGIGWLVCWVARQLTNQLTTQQTNQLPTYFKATGWVRFTNAN